MGAFEYRQAEEVRTAFEAYGVRYLFIGKSGAILLGFPDTTQDADLFVENSAGNGQALVRALRDLGFDLAAEQQNEILRRKDFIQLKNGPFDLEMIVLAKVKGLRIAEIAIPTIYAGEVSHLNPIKYGFDVLSIVRAYKRGKYHAM